MTMMVYLNTRSAATEFSALTGYHFAHLGKRSQRQRHYPGQ